MGHKKIKAGIAPKVKVKPEDDTSICRIIMWKPKLKLCVFQLGFIKGHMDKLVILSEPGPRNELLPELRANQQFYKDKFEEITGVKIDYSMVIKTKGKKFQSERKKAHAKELEKKGIYLWKKTTIPPPRDPNKPETVIVSDAVRAVIDPRILDLSMWKDSGLSRRQMKLRRKAEIKKVRESLPPPAYKLQPKVKRGFVLPNEDGTVNEYIPKRWTTLVDQIRQYNEWKDRGQKTQKVDSQGFVINPAGQANQVIWLCEWLICGQTYNPQLDVYLTYLEDQGLELDVYIEPHGKYKGHITKGWISTKKGKLKFEKHYISKNIKD